MAKNVLVLKHFESPKEAGVYYRLVCLTGTGKGQSYVLKGSRVVIGRSEKADIRLVDVKASREHAEITRVGDQWVATDLGSQNGIMVNDHKVVQQELAEGDKLIIGQTVFKFAKVAVSAKKKAIDGGDEEEEATDTRSKTPLMILAVIVLGFLMMDDKKPEAPAAPEPTNNGGYHDASTEYIQELKKRQVKEDKQLKEKLNVIYQRGLREYREANYYRAILEFNLALILAPGDAQAEYYLRKTKEDLDKSIEGFVNRAQQDEASLKYQSAIVSYCSIIRLLYAAPEDARYKNAENKIKKLENDLGLEPGETNCIKKPRTN